MTVMQSCEPRRATCTWPEAAIPGRGAIAAFLELVRLGNRGPVSRNGESRP